MSTIDKFCKDVNSLSDDECIRLNRALRIRRMELARSPDPLIARKTRQAKTATVRIGGNAYTGTIEERTVHCLTLRFADNRRLFLSMSALDPSGFDLPPTNSPACMYGSEAEDPAPVYAIDDLKIYNGRLYRVCLSTGALAECRVLYEGKEIEAIPVSYLKPLQQSREINVEL